MVGLLDGSLGSVLGKVIGGGQQGNALGGDFIDQIASKLGVDASQASVGLAQLLPTLIDKLTPNGAVPAEGDQLAQGLAGLRKLLG